MTGDEDQLKQVFINVIKNACESMSESEKKELTINISSDQNNLLLKSPIQEMEYQRKITAKYSLHSFTTKNIGREQDLVSQFLMA